MLWDTPFTTPLVSLARWVRVRQKSPFFDEATSALDSESEQTIKRNLDQLSRGRTAFIVTHRLASIRNADLIVVLDGGRVVETGDHASLLNKGGLYENLYRQAVQRHTKRLATTTRLGTQRTRPTGGRAVLRKRSGPVGPGTHQTTEGRHASPLR